MTEPLVEPELSVDDLSFTDLLRMALEEIPAASRGQWTLHGPVDPGITLLERFAWELEQRLFSAEQVTDQMVRASLRLLGLGDPSATRCARTVLRIDAGPSPSGGPVEVPAGTVFRLERDVSGRRCATVTPLTFVPMGPVTVTGRLFAVGDRLELTHRYTGPRLGADPLSFLVDVAAAPGVAPAWSTEAVDVPAPAELRWTAVGPDGSEAPVGVRDTTGGLRRSGLLVLDWPGVWNALGAGPCRLRATMTGGSYADPVRIRGIHPNAVPALDRVPDTLDVSDQVAALPPLPHGRVRLPATAGRLLDGPGDVSVELTRPDASTELWTSVADWTGVGPGDRVFVVDRARGELTFGDGRAGRILRLGVGARAGTVAVAKYATGGGAAGNVGPGGSWVGESVAATATNPVPAGGGQDAESPAAASLRAVDDRSAADRTVTAADAVELALATPGIGLQRAHASVGLHPDFPCTVVPSAVSVTVVPFADRSGDPVRWTPDPRPDDAALAAARAHLSGARLVGQEVFVLPPVYRSVSVRLTISRTALSPLLEERLRAVLRRHLDPLAGGADGQGWGFGVPVRPSALLGVVTEELGPEAAVTQVEVSLDGGFASSCDDLRIGERELVRFGDLFVAWTGSDPTAGGLL